jgi:hypothetical protein
LNGIGATDSAGSLSFRERDGVRGFDLLITNSGGNPLTPTLFLNAEREPRLLQYRASISMPSPSLPIQ